MGTSWGGDTQAWEDNGSFFSAQRVSWAERQRPGLLSLSTTNLLCDLTWVTHSTSQGLCPSAPAISRLTFCESLKMTEFAAGSGFCRLCLSWREIQEEREASASAVDSLWEMLGRGAGLAEEASTALCCALCCSLTPLHLCQAPVR